MAVELSKNINSLQRTLDWRHKNIWLDEIRHYAENVLAPDMIKHLIENRPECWSDDLTWLPDWSYILTEFTMCLTDYYTHFKGFHACRPTNIASYYTYGLLGQDSDYIANQFREIFKDVPTGDLDEAIDQLPDKTSSEFGKIWLSGSDTYLVEECGHYLIQGSELLMSLAASLGRSVTGEDYLYRLRTLGIPTIFEIDIPIGLIPQLQHTEVAKLILSEWGQFVSQRDLNFGQNLPTYVVYTDIPPECIRRHSHPSSIRDPHLRNKDYNNKNLVCTYCH